MGAEGPPLSGCTTGDWPVARALLRGQLLELLARLERDVASSSDGEPFEAVPGSLKLSCVSENLRVFEGQLGNPPAISGIDRE